MAFAPPIKAKISTNLAKSTWTPMNHPEANLQVRKIIVCRVGPN